MELPDEAHGGVIQIPISRKAWITGMTKGRDLIRENAATYGYSGSLGGLQRQVDWVNGDRHWGAILESRQIRDLDSTHWKALALDSFDYFMDLNADLNACYQITNRV